MSLLWRGSIIAIFVVFFSIIFHDLLTWIVFEQCDLNKFPLIYGVDGCYLFVNRSVNLKFHLGSLLLSTVGSKAIFHASMNNTLLIFKKLASKYDLQLFDDENEYTTKSSVNFTLDNLIEGTFISIGSNSTNKIRICPHKQSISTFIDLYNSSVNLIPRDQLLTSLWTLLKLNPEPLIMTLLKPPDWPVPRFYGSCGRLAVLENCGSSLTELINAPYQQRLNISLQIIIAAWKFTFSHQSFAFYLTDVSPDNIVVNENGLVKFIDLENVILVEKTTNGMPNDWFKNHSSIHYDCYDCISFSPDDICSHQLSDHNIYAVCKELFSPSSILPDGFLHSTPNDLPMKSYISDLINQCLTPTKDLSRFDTILELKKVFESILLRFY